MIREIDGGAASFLSQNSSIAHFGIGDAIVIDKITVYWTGGNVQSMTNVQANQLVEIKEDVQSQAKNSFGVLPIASIVVLLLLILFIALRRRIIRRDL